MNSVKYRPEIDGLRTLAVVPVIFFHGGVAGFSGGFVGVDIFFVISGFLITGILAEDFTKGQFSLLNFYERRARRILPALFLVVFACIPFAWFLFVPRDFVDFAQSIISTITFSSNILFWLETGYFATEAELKPLLHTWSLAVEEQFYLFFPLLIWGFWRFGKTAVIAVISVILLTSFALANWTVLHHPSASFYLLPTRAWELMIGALAALAVRSGRLHLSRPVGEVLSFTGIIFIIYSIVAFDNETLFPGSPALIPTLGAVFILLPASETTLVHRFLSRPFMVGIGLVSYSAYLWHQPLLAFTRYTYGEEPHLPIILGLILVCFVLAFLSWKFVEAPFRNPNKLSRRTLLVAGTGAAAVFCSVGVIVMNLQGSPSRIKIPEQIEASIERSSRQSECFDIEKLHVIQDWTCSIGIENGAPEFFVFGDSHAYSLLDVLDEAATKLGVSGRFSGASGCVPFLGVHALRKDQEVKTVTQQTYDCCNTQKN